MRITKKLKGIWFEWYDENYTCPMMLKYDDDSHGIFLTKRHLISLVKFILKNIKLSHRDYQEVVDILCNMH